jgi:hypothetical protein
MSKLLWFESVGNSSVNSQFDASRTWPALSISKRNAKARGDNEWRNTLKLADAAPHTMQKAFLEDFHIFITGSLLP